MTSRELVIRTLNHQPVSRIPRDLWSRCTVTTGPMMDELAEIELRYPSDIAPADVTPLADKKPLGKSANTGEYVDAWGCLWEMCPNGVSQLKQAPLAEASKIAAYHPPTDLLDRSRFGGTNSACHPTNRFVLGWSEVRPFDRLRFLRGSDTAIHDLARHSKAARSLRTMLHDLACKELELWASTDVDGVVFRDDWATADGLKISAEIWRDVFRPLYHDYCNILHSRDKFVFFQSSGDISDIFADLVKLEIDAVHANYQAMNIERLAKRHRGRVTFWGGIGQHASQEPMAINDVRESVLRLRRSLDFGCGGLIAQYQWDLSGRLATVAGYFEQWLAPLPMRI